MATKQGNLSINSENIFPIIKKWLYSDHDIFVRELISNGCDAITKLKKLDMMGEYTAADDEAYKIEVTVNPTEKTISFSDNGIGMTEDEVEKYITQIAFSGATDFIEKYKDKASEDQIIGHFGLGFYSAFMVADLVTIETCSYKENALPIHWESDGGFTYEMGDGTRTTHGTTITLSLNEESVEFSNEHRAREIIEKYCSFMPFDIYLTDETKEPEYEEVEVDEENGENTVVDENGESIKEKKLVEPTPLNTTTPLYAKHPNECTEEDYKKFFRDTFMDFKEPLFWIHLNMDYPFNLKGILYFPKINSEYESIEGMIKLYNNRVFIADNIKEVIPEFLLLLKGVIDCPDLPLNVSRSALQNDGFVKKISDYITKKVADKLSGMCKTSREEYEKYWDDINPFIKFGCLKDEKFAEKMNDSILFKNLDNQYLTLDDALRANEETNKNKIFYVTNEAEQGQYIHMFKEANTDAVLLTHNIDTPFVSLLESKNKDVKFIRIDSELTDSFKEDTDEAFIEESASLVETFKNALQKDGLEIKVEKIKNPAIASIITMSEEGRRMQEMMKMYSMYGMDPSMFGKDQHVLVLNNNHPLIQYIKAHAESEDIALYCEQVYDLALLAHGSLSAEQMTAFIERSNQIMLKETK